MEKSYGPHAPHAGADTGRSGGKESVTVLIQQSDVLQGATDLRNLWSSIRSCLQDYIGQDSLNGRYAKLIAHHSRQFINAVQNLPNYQQHIDTLQSQPRFDSPWYRYQFAGDGVMQAELITVFGECPTPIHSYDGLVGVVFVVDGELTLYRYAEKNNSISDCSAITNLDCQRVDRYAFSQGTLIDSLSTPVVEMQANTERCIFFNIHLQDHAEYPHYFYYPSYVSHTIQARQNGAFFANRILSEW